MRRTDTTHPDTKHTRSNDEWRVKLDHIRTPHTYHMHEASHIAKAQSSSKRHILAAASTSDTAIAHRTSSATTKTPQKTNKQHRRTHTKKQKTHTPDRSILHRNSHRMHHHPPTHSHGPSSNRSPTTIFAHMHSSFSCTLRSHCFNIGPSNKHTTCDDNCSTCTQISRRPIRTRAQVFCANRIVVLGCIESTCMSARV